MDWLFVFAAALVVLFVSLLPSPRDRNPPVPRTPDHQGLTTEKDCLRCHVVGGMRPLAGVHPKRQDCWRCHKSAMD